MTKKSFLQALLSMTAVLVMALFSITPLSAQNTKVLPAPLNNVNKSDPYLHLAQSNSTVRPGTFNRVPNIRVPGRGSNPDRPGRRPDRSGGSGGFRPGFGVIIDLGSVDDEPRRPRRPRREVIIEDEKPGLRRKQAKPAIKNSKDRPVIAKTEKLRQFRDNELVILIQKDQSKTTENDIAKTYNLQALNGHDMPLINARMQRYRIKAKGVDIWKLVQKIKNDKRVLSAQPNYIYRVLKESAKAQEGKKSESQNTQKDMQYALKQLHVDEAHLLTKGRNVKIAVIDSGIETTHPAFQNAIAARYNAVDGSQDYKGHTHGTAIAGIIAARGDVTGIAPEATLLDARAFFMDKETEKSETDSFILLKAMQWSYDQGARVFNMSFAGPRDPALALAVEELQKKDVILIAASGNAGAKAPPAYPAAYKNVVAVTAVDQNEKIYKDANQGSYVSIAAPGVDILVVTPEKSYDYSTGTSMAAAHVSGLVALMLEQNPKLTREDIFEALVSEARDLGKPGTDPAYGAGLVDARKSVQNIAEGVSEKSVSQKQDGPKQ